eukprot:173928-Chlamydomonas_euryale.AAC.2
MAAMSRWKLAICASDSFFFQLNDGEQLYASSLPGYAAWIAAANSRASSMLGSLVSNHSRSAYSAYARPRAIADSRPPRIA